MPSNSNHGSRLMSILLVLLMASAGAGARQGGGDGAAAVTSGAAEGGTAGPGGPPGPADPVESGQSATAVATGVYRGQVLERKGGKPVPGAVIVFIEEETGETFEYTTDKDGAYEARLPAGEYVVDIRVGKKTYRSAGTFREEAAGKRWVMDFTIGSKLTEKDLKIETTPRDVRVIQTEPRPPLQPSRKMMELFLFLGGVIGVAALSE